RDDRNDGFSYWPGIRRLGAPTAGYNLLHFSDLYSNHPVTPYNPLGTVERPDPVLGESSRFWEGLPMNANAGPEVNASSTPRANAKLEADEAAKFERELTDDELALIAGGVGGNETHTMAPASAEMTSSRAQRPLHP